MKKALVVCHMGRHYKKFGHYDIKPLQELGYDVHFASNFSLDIDKVDDSSITLHQIDFERSPFSLKNVKAYKQIKKVIKDGNYDLIHCQSPVGGVLTRLAYKNIKNKKGRIIYTAHGFHFYKGASLLYWLLFYPIEKYLSKYTDTLITINKEDYNLAKNKFKKCRDIQYIPGVGIDTKRFEFNLSNEEKRKLRKSLHLKTTDFVMIYPAELLKRKGQIWLINSVSEFLKKNKNVHLLLPGKDSLDNKCHKLVKLLDLEKQIHILGHRTDIPSLLKISNIAVSSSSQEGLPLNIMEDMYVGLPIVALDCRGMSDLIENGRNGFIVNTKEEFIDRIKLLLNDKKLCNNMAKTNASDSLKYDVSVISKKIKEIFVNNKVRVFHLLSSNKYSGAENVACMIINNLKDGYDMAYCSPMGDIKNKLLEYNIKYIPIKKMSFFEIKRAIDKCKPDIIHAHDFRASCYASLFYKKYKIISHIHGNNKVMNTRNFKSFLYKYLLKRFSKIIWVSDSSYNEYYYCKKASNNSTILYNVIDDKELVKKANDWICDEYCDLIFLGRLAYPKNPERLIEIIKLVNKRIKNFRVSIVGDGVDKQKVIDLIQKYHLNSVVKLYGFQNNPYPILKKSKIMVMTSIYEGTPMSALEALCLGKPIIATPVDGLKKIVKNGVNGYLTNDDYEFANKIIYLLKNSKKLAEMSKNSIQVYKSNFNLDKYIDSINSIYKE